MISTPRAWILLCGLLLTADALAASVTVVSGAGQTTRSGTLYAQPVVVQVRDASGAPLQGAFVALTSPAGSPRGVLNQSAMSPTNSQGLLSIDVIVAVGAAGSVSVDLTVGTFTANEDFPGVFEMHVTGLPPANVELVAGANQATLINEPFAAPLAVRVLDPSGVPIPGAVVQFGVADNCNCGLGPPGWPNGVFLGGSPLYRLVAADDRGIATSPRFGADSEVGAWTMMAEAFDTQSPGPFAGAPMRNLLEATPAAPVSVQDMWWAGPGENGWGMSIAQSGDNLFAGIYGYDASGRPTWNVMSSGNWNSARTVFSGLLYSPQGSPFFAYDPSRFQAGAPVGIATLTFTGPDTAELDLVVDGVSTRKSISRQQFGAGAIAGPVVGGMWWGGLAQNGWGVSIMQQGPQLFSVWFTYDESGRVVWYVLPGGDWTSATSYEGRVYKTSGSLLAAYDPARFRISDVGSYRLRFEGEAATLEYTVEGRSGTLSLTRQPF